jgi:hypothetical protein
MESKLKCQIVFVDTCTSPCGLDTSYEVAIKAIPKQTSAERHKFVIIATKYFTKWVEVKLLASKECKRTAHFFFIKIILRHNKPLEILTNNGLEVCNALDDIVAIHMRFKHFMTSLTIHNAMARLRFNRTLCMLLEKNNEFNDLWHTTLPAILFAYRMNVHGSMGLLSFELLYGQKPNLPMARMAPSTIV